MSTTPHHLRPEEARAYAEDGFFVREAVFDKAEVDALRAAAERVATRAKASAALGESYLIDGNRYVETPAAVGSTVQFEHSDASDTIRVIEPFHHLDAAFDRLIDDARIVEPMRGVIGSDTVALWTDKLNLKRPREGSRFRWHQDSPYWTHACGHVDRLPNVMLALDDALEANGCFRVIRGSHKQGCLPGIQDDTQIGVLFTDPAHFDASHEVAAEMPSGSLIFFSPHTVHGSQPNESELPRRALILTYQPGGNAMFRAEGVRDAG